MYCKFEEIFEYINEFQEKDGQTSLFDSGIEKFTALCYNIEKTSR